MNLDCIAVDKSPIEMLYYWVNKSPNEVYLRQPIDDVWYEYTWKEVAEEARRLTGALYCMGLEKGDKVAIISKNCAQWIITDLALQLGGFVSVPLYVDQTPDILEYVLKHSEAKALFVGKLDKENWDYLKESVPEHINTIGFSFHGLDSDFMREGLLDYNWDSFVKNAPIFIESPIPKESDIWTIVYTSGTTGYPKGVVHTYRTPKYLGSRVVDVFQTSPDDMAFSFLPLAHVAERFGVATNSLYGGMPISFTQSLNTFQKDIQSVQPTLFFSVPRLWKKFQGGILQKLSQNQLDLLLRIPFINSYIKKKLSKALGLSRARLVFSGASPISTGLLDWYKNIGIEILEGYGMTENFAYGFTGRSGKSKAGTVGQAMPGSGFKLSEDGEVLFKSKTLMEGYFKDEAKTTEAMTEDGFFRTGDSGEIDRDGNLRITGRIKETFKTAKGEFVAPLPIENKLSSLKEYEQICLGGLGLTQPVAIVTLSENALNKSKSELESLILNHTTNVNKSLLNHEKISGVVVAKSDWLPDSGLVTSTLKVKRNKVEEHYRELMQFLDLSNKRVVWE